MKSLVSILCISSALCAVSPEEELSTISLDLQYSQEIVALDSTSVFQEPFTSSDLQIPPPRIELSRKSPSLAANLSIIPGLGHVYLGDYKTAGGLFGSTCLGLSAGVASAAANNLSTLVPSAVTVQNIWFYGIYAAYRDARLFNGLSHYSYKMPTDNLIDLAAAPFSWKVIKKPEVWGGLLGALGVGITAGYLMSSETADAHLHLSPFMQAPFLALPIGIGEESFFRGYLQSQLAEVFSPAVGIALASLAFGAVHIPNARMIAPELRWRYYSVSLPIITGLGAYFGWLTHKNHSLKESVALHMWYDFVIFTAGYLASRASATPRPGFAMAVPF